MNFTIQFKVVNLKKKKGLKSVLSHNYKKKTDIKHDYFLMCDNPQLLSSTKASKKQYINILFCPVCAYSIFYAD